MLKRRKRTQAILGIGFMAVGLATVALLLRPNAPTEVHPLRDIDGKLHGSLISPETDLTVLFFLGTSCPISAQYAPEIGRICDGYGPKGAGCFLVFPDASTTPTELKKHLADYSHRSPAILDLGQSLVKAAGATVTPEAAVFSHTGELLYRGRIDDLYAGLGKQRPQATEHDLRNALDAIIAGKPVRTSRTEPVGCYIEPPASQSRGSS